MCANLRSVTCYRSFEFDVWVCADWLILRSILTYLLEAVLEWEKVVFNYNPEVNTRNSFPNFALD